MIFDSSYQLPILMYHRVVKTTSEVGKHNIYITEKRLRKEFEYLKKRKISTITFRDLQSIQALSELNNKLILTFDDGYEDNYHLLFPLLKEFNFTAVIFLVTRQKQNIWGIREGEPALNLMNDRQIIEMDKYGVEFGGHTQNHIDLSQYPYEEQLKEVSGCKIDIEKIIHKPVISFAYPFGGINDEAKKAVKNAGYKYGIATKTGPFQFHQDLFQIRRIEISSRTTLTGFKRKASGYYFKKSSIVYYLPFK